MKKGRRERREAYLAKLRDPRWQKKRLEVLERDGWFCARCGDEKSTLHVHHRYYKSGEPWDAPLDSLVTLCAMCHETETELRPVEEKTLLDALRYTEFMAEDILDIARGFAFMARTKHLPEAVAPAIEWMLKSEELLTLVVDAHQAYRRSLRTDKSEEVVGGVGEAG